MSTPKRQSQARAARHIQPNPIPAAPITQAAVSLNDAATGPAVEPIGPKEHLGALHKDHGNALTEANNQAKLQFTLSQLFVTIIFTAFGLAFEKKIEAVFAILPLFGGMCVMTLFWKDVMWYLAIKRVVDLEQEINRLTEPDTMLWGTIHGESYINYGFFNKLESRYGLKRLRKMMALCYFYIAFMYTLVLVASITVWSLGGENIFGPADPTTAQTISQPVRTIISLIHVIVFVLILYLWGQRRKWQAELEIIPKS